MHKELRRYGKIAVNLVLAVVVLVIFIWIVPKVILFFMPLLIGWLIALVANPLVKFLEEKLKIKRKAVSGMVVILVLAGVILIGYLIFAKLVTESMGFINNLPNLWNSLQQDTEVISQKLDVIYQRLPIDLQVGIMTISDETNTYVKEFLGKAGTPTVIAISAFAKNIPSFVINVIMCILSAYFFTSEKEYISQAMRKIAPVSIQKKWDIVYISLKKAVGGYFKAQIKIEIWIYLLMVIGLMILHIDYALLIALGVAILDFLPFFGTGAVMIPWAIVKFLSSDYTMSIGLLIIWGVSQLVRQIIQPKIMGDSIGMRPIPTIFLLFIGYKIGGVLGMIVALPIGIIICNMYQSGIFETTQMSLLLLTKSLNNFRKYDKEDIEYLKQDVSDRNEKKKSIAEAADSGSMKGNTMWRK